MMVNNRAGTPVLPGVDSRRRFADGRAVGFLILAGIGLPRNWKCTPTAAAITRNGRQERPLCSDGCRSSRTLSSRLQPQCGHWAARAYESAKMARRRSVPHPLRIFSARYRQRLCSAGTRRARALQNTNTLIVPRTCPNLRSSPVDQASSRSPSPNLAGALPSHGADEGAASSKWRTTPPFATVNRRVIRADCQRTSVPIRRTLFERCNRGRTRWCATERTCRESLACCRRRRSSAG